VPGPIDNRRESLGIYQRIMVISNFEPDINPAVNHLQDNFEKTFGPLNGMLTRVVHICLPSRNVAPNQGFFAISPELQVNRT
jgi:hypothetical protein